ncbi:MAG: SDR family oxidoreductase [Sandaracinus sp.]|nr:SDR family oxidoreductase [Sandaracinus sp.]MCB9614211.1 SDR family oxidoreductase [Sandaracinus sp.]MCB9620096.1 SDR family oxidoreductase [Sandaracinus sp.]MCB9622532.1 SDR family oxidoreductase [Sandaracinus sp.]
MKTALVTGASRGMGAEWVRQLTQRGWRVVLTARSRAKAEEAATPLLAEGAKVLPRALDVSDEASIASLFRALEGELEALDLVVNNAGVNPKDHPDPTLFRRTFELTELDPDAVTECIRTNGVMPVIVAKHALPLLRRSTSPLVLSISSWLGSIGEKSMGGHYGYATSKAALNMMNRAMALQLRDAGIVAVVVNPGWVQTDMGGARATLTTEESVGGMLRNVVDRVTLVDSGKFFQWDGSEHPW